MGDFNAKIGRESNYLVTAGNFSSGETTNENGELLVKFAEKNRLKITNTFYKKRASKKSTSQSPDKNRRNETDYFLANDLSIVKDVTFLKSFTSFGP